MGRSAWLAAVLIVAGCSSGRRGGASVSAASGALSAAGVAWTSTEFLGRPTDSSVTLQAIAAQAVDAYVEYGTSAGSYPSRTVTTTFADGFVQILVAPLLADTAYVYRLRYRAGGSTDAFTAGGEHRFHTQRARGQTFSFAVQADSHQGFLGFYDDNLYRRTMQNILAEGNDFMLDLGDTVSLDDAVETAATVAQKYLNQLAVFDLAAHSTPVFLVMGNHEREEGWNLTELGADVADTLPVLNANARKRYFLNPVPDGFYSGDTDTSGGAAYVSGDHLRADYYAFQWGDALFVAIEPFWYSQKKPYAGAPGGDRSTAPVGTRWDWTLGKQQYEWLRQTLADSTATYKFVFAHHVAGGIEDYGRGGTLAAKYCEWGGYDPDGQTYTFDTNRPGWEAPVHQVLAQNHVTAFFHAHDHVYAQETLDGVVYQTTPMAANPNYDLGFDSNPIEYAGAKLIANSGHLRVTVSAGKVTVDYVRSFLPGDGVNGTIAATYDVLAPSEPDAGAGGAGGSSGAGAGGAGGLGGGNAGAGGRGGGNGGAGGLGGAGGGAAGAGGQAGVGGQAGASGGPGAGGGAGEMGAAGVSGAGGAGGVPETGGTAGGAGAGGLGGEAEAAAGTSGASGAPAVGGSGAAPPAGGAGGAAGGGGAAGALPAGGASGAAGGGAAGSSHPAAGAGGSARPGTDGGCGCETGGPPSGAGLLFVTTSIMLLGWRRRHRGGGP